MNAQAAAEISAMETDLKNATTSGDLINLYWSWMDCEPEADATNEDVRADLADYIKEFRYACASGQS